MLSQNAFTARRNVHTMTAPPRKKKRCVEKIPDGEVDEICSAMEDSKRRGEETEEQFRMKGVD